MSAFGDAFKAARAAGKKTFTFNGKSYHTRTKEDEGKPAAKPDVSKATAGPAVYEKKKAASKPKSSDLDRELNREGARQVQKSQENYMKKLPDNRPPAKDATFSDKGAPERKSPEMKKLPDNRPPAKDATFSDKGAPERKSPAMIKTDDTSLSVNERFKRDVKDNLKGARSSNTGTDKRSVTQRFKDALGMKRGGTVKAAKKGSKARGGGAATRGTKFSGVF